MFVTLSLMSGGKEFIRNFTENKLLKYVTDFCHPCNRLYNIAMKTNKRKNIKSDSLLGNWELECDMCMSQ